MCNLPPSSFAETEGVITAVATLIAQEPEPADDNNRLQYLETDIRKLYALETEWKRCVASQHPCMR